MSFNRSAVLLVLTVLGTIVAFTPMANGATVVDVASLPNGNAVFTGTVANATSQWDVLSSSLGDVKETTGPIDTSDLLDLLATSFDDVDTDGDGFVSFAEASAALPGLTMAVFASVDTNGDGLISKEEAGIDGGCNCNGIDWSNPGTIIVALLSLLGLILGYRACNC